ncbi:MAG TPA: flavin reductase family protein [Steroidobacteraceae bacterium]|nr:flavin reductase family protein [Steroidobacteraceae bacterium]
MDDTFHFYEPARGHGLAHDPFNAIIGPRPIGWISTHDGVGHFNLAPYSFFNAFAYKPPVIGFSSSGRKDTLRNVERTGEFVWNLATMALARQMNASSATAPPQVSEFDLAGLTPVAAAIVGAPRVAESPVAFECKVTQILQLQDRQQEPMPNWVVFGEVVGAHVARRLLVNGIYDTAAAHPVLRAGGPDAFVEVRPENVFRMKRPA